MRGTMRVSRRTFARGAGLTALSGAGILLGGRSVFADNAIKFDLRYMEPPMGDPIRTAPQFIRLRMTDPIVPEKSRLHIMGRTGVPQEIGPVWADPEDPSILVTNFPNLPDDRYVVYYKVYSTNGEFVANRAEFSLATHSELSDIPPGWPPVRMGIVPKVDGRLVTYEAWLWNVSMRRTKTAVVRTLIPTGAKLVRSYLWDDGSNPGKSDGQTVTWTLTVSVPPSVYDVQGQAGRPYGPFGYVIDTTGMAPGTQLVSRSTVDWSLWWEGSWWNNEAWEGEQHGLSVSDDIVLTVGPDGSVR